MSPLGIKRAVAIILILSPWIFIPGLFKDVFFIIIGILLFISTLDLRKKNSHNHHYHNNHEETDSVPKVNTTIGA